MSSFKRTPLLVTIEETSMLVQKSMKTLAIERKQRTGISYTRIDSIIVYPIAGIIEYINDKYEEVFVYEE